MHLYDWEIEMDLLKQTCSRWKWHSNCPGETAIESLELAWRSLFGHQLGNLPEPYDFDEKGTIVYFLPPRRFIKVNSTKTPCDIEILERAPLYYLRSFVHGQTEGSPRYCEHYPTDLLALYYLGLQAQRDHVCDGFAVYRFDINATEPEKIYTWSIPWI